MRIHHLNCGTLSLGTAPFVCHVLLIETRGGLVLVDSGFGLGDVRDPLRLGEAFLAKTRPHLDERETAVRRIEALGLRPDDVRHVLMTHLDRDHAGGIGDFPDATVHVHPAEHACAIGGAPGVRPGRYVTAQWRPDTRWSLLGAATDDWFGLPAVRPIADEPDIVAVPLPGHTPGQCGVAIRTGAGWLLHAADSHYHHAQRRLPPEPSTPEIDAFQAATDSDTADRERSQAAVARLAARPDIDVICTHDPHDFDRFAHAGA